MKVPERFRYNGVAELKSTAMDGNNGAFVMPHYRIRNYEFMCISCDQLGWEHVSVTVRQCNKNPTRCPTWEEMCWIKDQFWNEEEVVMQIHPKKSDYVNEHNHCLHLWRPTKLPIPLPNPLMVGIK